MMKKPILMLIVLGLLVLGGIVWAKNGKKNENLGNLVGNTNLTTPQGNSGNLGNGNSGNLGNNRGTLDNNANTEVEKFSPGFMGGPTPTNPPDRHAERINPPALLREEPVSGGINN